MKQEYRSLIRAFYQNIPTPEEKAAFQAVLEAPKEDRLAYIATLIGNQIPIDRDTVAAIMAVTSLTKEDRVMIFSGGARQLIFRILSYLGL